MTNTARFRRLYIENSLNAPTEVVLNKADSHYLINVMRLNVGDEILLFNGCDGEWQATLKKFNKKTVTCFVHTQTREQSEVLDLWIVFAPVKKARLDYMAQKITELGVCKIIPVQSEKTIVTRVKTSRLIANAKEAAEQCERLTVPSVEEFQKLKTCLSAWPEERKLLFCDETKQGPLINNALLKIDSKPTKNPWGVLIGPEGGFSDCERSYITSFPFVVSVSLGPRILRADTAAIAAIALWQAVLGDW